MTSYNINSSFKDPYSVYDIKLSSEVTSADEKAEKTFFLCV